MSGIPPAPWHVEDDFDEHGYGTFFVCHVDTVCDATAVCSLDDSDTAYLIASAPELLEALEYAIEKYGKPGGPWNVPSDPGGWLDRARAAIAKARGETA